MDNPTVYFTLDGITFIYSMQVENRKITCVSQNYAHAIVYFLGDARKAVREAIRVFFREYFTELYITHMTSLVLMNDGVLVAIVAIFDRNLEQKQG